MAALIGAALLLWWCGTDDDVAQVTDPKPAAVVLPLPRIEAAPTTAAPAVPVAAVLPGRAEDAGRVAIAPAVQPVDSGLSQQLLVEQTLRRWREALLPLFIAERARARRSPPAVIAVTGSAASSAAPAERPACEAGVQQLALSDQGTVDLVIVIDTSGSMSRELKEIVPWLAMLELGLREKRVDFQMLVVADHRSLDRVSGRRELDAGLVQLSIGSRDSFETLINAAKEGPPPRWHQRLRPGSTKHLIMVTDDEARDPSGLTYLPPLLAAAEGALGTVGAPAFTLHLLGGFASSAPDRVMQPEEQLMKTVCQTGVAAGAAYQRIAQATGGLRASLCEPRALKEFSSQLIGWPVKNAVSPCVWLLPPQSTVSDARAHHSRLSTVRLSEARSPDACFNRNDAYRVSGQVFALCGSTCAALTDGGYHSIEVSTRCEQ